MLAVASENIILKASLVIRFKFVNLSIFHEDCMVLITHKYAALVESCPEMMTFTEFQSVETFNQRYIEFNLIK